jgi:hypothetical protein
MASNDPVDIQFSREDLRRRGARDRLYNPPVIDDAFDSLLAKLQSAGLPSGDQSRRWRCHRSAISQQDKG